MRDIKTFHDYSIYIYDKICQHQKLNRYTNVRYLEVFLYKSGDYVPVPMKMLLFGFRRCPKGDFTVGIYWKFENQMLNRQT